MHTYIGLDFGSRGMAACSSAESRSLRSLELQTPISAPSTSGWAGSHSDSSLAMPCT